MIVMIEPANQNPYGGGSIVPPPPDAGSSLTEVSIRTMASDLAMLGQTGGSTIPAGETLSISFDKPKKSDEKMRVVVQGAEGTEERPAGRHATIAWVAVGFVGLALLFLLGFYVLPKLVSFLTPSSSPPSNNDSNLGSLPSEPTSPAPLPPPPPAHASFFRMPIDEKISITLDSSKTGPTGTNPFAAGVLAAIATSNAKINLFELEILEPSGKHFSWTDFLAARNAPILSGDTFATRFGDDFTAFVYRDQKGSWPGYIIKLKREYSPLTLATAILEIEKNIPMFKNLAVTPLGNPSGIFRDARIVNEPIRSLDFSPKTTVSYGWFYGTYLIFSTSDEGLRQILQKL